MQPDQLELLGGQHPLDRLRGEAVLEPEPELRVQLPGADVVVGGGADAGGDADQDPASLLQQSLAALDLVEGVEDQVPDTGPGREANLVVGLVVAVHVDPSGVEAGGQRQVQLAAGGDVHRQALLAKEPVGGAAGKGLARVEDLEAIGQLGEGAEIGAGPVAHVVLGIDVGGGAELGRQVDDVAAPDLEVAAVVDPAAVRIDRGPGDRVRAGDRLCVAGAHGSGIVTPGGAGAAGSPP